MDEKDEVYSSFYPEAVGAVRLKRIDFYDRTLSLKIDAIVSSLKDNTRRGVVLADRWSSQDPIPFARRALEVAIWYATDAIRERIKGDWVGQWERSGDLAKSAADAVSAFNINMSDSRNSGRCPSVEAIAYPIRTMSSRMMPGASALEGHDWANKAAGTLLEAHRLLCQLSDQMKLYRDEIAISRQNPGEPEKAAFIEIWAEAWIFLTGRIPGTGTEKNPFLDLVSAAWSDAGGPTDQSFISALRRWRSGSKTERIAPGSFIPTWGGAMGA